MSYSAQAQLSADGDFTNRVAACAAVEVDTPDQPTAWARDNIWRIAASPGFADKYEYALNTDVENPGADPAVITDGDILAAVQAMIAPPEQPESQQQGEDNG